jgi:hypothetical protein
MQHGILAAAATLDPSSVSIRKVKNGFVVTTAKARPKPTIPGHVGRFIAAHRGLDSLEEPFEESIAATFDEAVAIIRAHFDGTEELSEEPSAHLINACPGCGKSVLVEDGLAYDQEGRPHRCPP